MMFYLLIFIMILYMDVVVNIYGWVFFIVIFWDEVIVGMGV